MKQKLLQLTALVCAVASLFAAAPASAASNGLGITPRKDYTVKAGDSVSDKLYVSNLSTNQDLDLSIRLVDFKAQDETGTPALDLSENAPQTPWSLKPFAKLPATLHLGAGKSTYVPFTITIPAGQGAGSYYSAVQFAAQNSPEQKKVSIAASSTTLLFVNVPGKATESLNLLRFGAFKPSADDQSGSFSSLFVASQPTVLAYRARNNGNVAEQPTGSIVVKNSFGKQVALIQDVNPKKQLALRGQIRRFEVCLKSEAKTVTQNGQQSTEQVCGSAHLWPGRYTAQMDVFYGLSGNASQEIAATATFWYLPWWFLIGVLVVVAAVVFLAMWAYRKLTGRRRRR